MPANPVVFIDTSVFANLIEVNGRCDERESVLAEFDRFSKLGAKFVLPITTVIETGNLIFYSSGDRRPAAQRLVQALQAAREANPPWTVRAVNWDDDFVSALIGGDSTGSSLVDLISEKRLATGDVGILVERDQFLAETAFTDVRVWSLDAQLRSLSAAPA